MKWRLPQSRPEIRLIAFAFTLIAGLLASVPSRAQQPESTTDTEHLQERLTEPQGFLAEPDVVLRAALFGDRQLASRGVNEGFHVVFGNMIPGAGWLSIGPGYRRWYDRDRILFESSATLSLHDYKSAQGRIEFPKLLRSRLTLGTQVRWDDFTQVSFWGDGSDSLEGAKSQYGIRTGTVGGYGILHPLEWVDVGVQVGWLTPSIRPSGGFFKGEHPDTRELVPNDVVFAVGDQPSFLQRKVSITADTRDFPGHPTKGALLRASAGDFSDRDANRFSFGRYELEGATFVPLVDSRVVIGLHAWLVSSDPGRGQVVPFYLQPSLSGPNTLRSYADYRFHDQNMMVVNAEARIAIMTHVDAAVFVDAGNVARTIGEVNLDKKWYGFGLRLHSRRQTFARMDVAHGREGWRVMFRLNDPWEFGRVSRRTAIMPFVP